MVVVVFVSVLCNYTHKEEKKVTVLGLHCVNLAWGSEDNKSSPIFG